MPVTPRPVALVTGAARRLGRAIALELARAGHDVALHFRSSQAEAEATAAAIRETGARAELMQADLAVEAECEALCPPRCSAWAGSTQLCASLFDYDDVELQLWRDGASLARHRCHIVLARCHAPRRARIRCARLRDPPARPEAVEPQP
jgi:nucleoside-diphosphate-sugar epimerase